MDDELEQVKKLAEALSHAIQDCGGTIQPTLDEVDVIDGRYWHLRLFDGNDDVPFAVVLFPIDG